MATVKTKKTTTKKTASRKQQVIKVADLETVGRGNLARSAFHGIMLPPKVVAQIAEEVARKVAQRVPRPAPRRKQTEKKESPGFILDTSAIIDGRIFELAKTGVFFGNFIIMAGVLDELKNIADSKDDVKKERGRRALHNLDEFKKNKDIKLVHVEDLDNTLPVDERLIAYAKKSHGRIITCDYNLSKKAKITGAVSIDVFEMANILKTTAVPGEEFFVKVVQKGKGPGQGVGYLPDGTMIVVEHGENLLDKAVKVVVSRVIATDAGRIFFGKIVE